MPLLAYLLTFSTYGTHLPGSETGWVDTKNRAYGSPRPDSDPLRKAYWERRLQEDSWTLDAGTRQIAQQAMLSVCQYRGWTLHALHIRTNHVHAVVAGDDTSPERMLSDFKAYATRALRRALPASSRRRYWTDHGSTRYLWNKASVEAAIAYVLHAQGERMACYPQSAV